jgi:hypothetical protein
MDATDHERPLPTDTAATMPDPEAPDAPKPADKEGATLAAAPSAADDPTHESGYGFGV